MALTGLTRTPYFPVLTALFPQDNNSVLLLSALLYWCSRFRNSSFNERTHIGQFAVHLNLSIEQIKHSLNEIKKLNIINEKRELKEKKKDPNDGNQNSNKIKENILLNINYKKLSELLKSHNIDLSAKVLKHSADDSFDFFATIGDYALPLEQKLIGCAKDKIFTDVAFALAKLLVYIANFEDDFAFKALAPGWRMLIQPPATYQDIASRWLGEDDRAIDIEFSDGTFFLPDGDKYGAQEHLCLQRGKKEEPQILAAAFLLTAQESSQYQLRFISDLSPALLEKAINLVNRALTIKPKLLDIYYRELM